jgi:hypothetical protein
VYIRRGGGTIPPLQPLYAGVPYLEQRGEVLPPILLARL